ncbi:siderophore-interacting protein [Williamsia sterculiae]|uniref:NADPH-dependent ferric siderophore reductase, contains FAD-binding and SIP domains n=1 Tax=Williamsia sterculiae TaxID=1344003 RepID=A0A1N7DHU2_9NOCA|nr:siderophore-interacting protein [Williamsia sterculiae]SIR75368.1 NADPH-dependent ferric siderophore reductase, contains FAD-binding and SIP domains [Williamsia sterculiae]
MTTGTDATRTIKAAIRRRAQRTELRTARTTVVDTVILTRDFTRLTLRTDDLGDYHPEPADAFKLMLPIDDGARTDHPRRGDDGLPRWPEGATQPVLRALTVRHFDPARGLLTVDVARHQTGPLMSWLATVRPGDAVDLAGMRAEWHLPQEIRDVILMVDGSGLPGAAGIVERLPDHVTVIVYVIDCPRDDLVLIPAHPRLSVIRVGAAHDIGHQTPRAVRAQRRVQVWIAAETGDVRVLRSVVTRRWHVPGDDILARAYWTSGRSSTDVDATNLVRYQHAIAGGADVHDPVLAENIDLDT